MTVKKQETTTPDGCICKKNIKIDKVRFNILNFVVGVLEEEKKETRMKMMMVSIYTSLILVIRILKRMTLLEPLIWNGQLLEIIFVILN